jgi:hypothetical protein
LLCQYKYRYIHLYQVYKHHENRYVGMIIEHDKEYVIHPHHLELVDSKKKSKNQ